MYMYMYMKSCTCSVISMKNYHLILKVITSYKDSIVAILHIQNSIILIQTTEYNHNRLYKYNIIS